ncbi:MAG: PrsW family intramembrane metalloprotease [Streptosporangiaceae bacterium]
MIEGRPPGRTRVGLIAAIMIAGGCALIVLIVYLAESIGDGRSAAPFLLALPLALLPVPVLVAGILWVDRLEPEPRADMTFTFLWGAGVAALLALVINTAGLVYITAPALGATTGEYVSAALGAPVVEETLKGLVFVWLLRRRRLELDGPTDGITYATLVGLGFAMMENIGYYINALVTPEFGGVRLLGYTFVVRGLLSPLLHPMFTSMTGIGAAYAASHKRSNWALILGWCGAMLLHGMWNSLDADGTDGMLLGYGLMALVLIGLIWVLVWDRRRIVEQIRDYLPAYQQTGLVTPDDITMLSTLASRRRARRWARSAGGGPAATAMADYQLAATELALLHPKAERGVIEPGYFRKRQHDLLGLMNVARQAFLSRGSTRRRMPWTAAPSGFAHAPVSRAPLPPHPLPPRY